MWALLGIAILVVGFVARFNPLLVVVAAALATGVLGAIDAGAPLAPQPLFLALVHTVEQLGQAYNKNRYISVIWMILPLIGLLEREGLQERARGLVARIHAATVGRLLLAYFLIRQITAALGLTSMLGHAQSVRPLLAPMAEGALEKRYGSVPAKVRERVRAWAAAADNIAVFYGEDMFIAIGAILLIVGTMEGFGVKVQPLTLSLWSIPTAICAFLVQGARVMRLDRRLDRELGAER